MDVNTYRTIQGDTFDGIAFKLWGQERLAHQLMQANAEHMDVVFFPAGVTLRVPTGIHKAERTFTLPPWAKNTTRGERP